MRKSIWAKRVWAWALGAAGAAALMTSAGAQIGAGYSTPGPTTPTGQSGLGGFGASPGLGSSFNQGGGVGGGSSSFQSPFSQSGSGGVDRFGRSATDSASPRSSASRRTNSTANGPAKPPTGVAGAPSRAMPQGVSVVKRQGASGGAATKGGASGVALPEIKISPDLRANALYLTPSTMRIAPGDRFITSLVSYDAENQPIDRMDLWVHYDQTLLVPEWVDAEKMATLAGNMPKLTGWPDRGYMRIEVALKKANAESVHPLVEIHWRALQPTIGTTIELEGPRGTHPGLYDGAIDILASAFVAGAPTIGTVVRIAPDGDVATGMRMIDEVRQTLTPAPPTAALERVRLAIVAAEPRVASMEESTADVVLINPTGAPLDDLKFRIRYDPAAIKVLDADADNYINAGVNIFDGDFHAEFPFDYFGANRADASRGTIDYHVGSASGARAYASGAVARIAYRMLAPAGKAAFWFEYRDPTTGEVTTNISNAGRSLIQLEGENPAAALHGTEIAALPGALHAAAVGR